MKNEEKAAFIRGKIVAICEAILNDEIGIIAGSRTLNRLEVELLHNEVSWFQRAAAVPSYLLCCLRHRSQWAQY
jgi:hypothetical protein